MRILVTGATGFIGSAFVRNAVRHGHEVGALIRPGTAVPKNFPPEVTRLVGTMAEPPLRQIQEFSAECCVHAAWIATPGTYLESSDNELWKRWSFDFLRHIAELGTKQILVLGTCIEYSISREPLSESTPLMPISLYARCKNELRLMLENESSISLCWGRVFYPYGPGEHPDRLCSSIVRKLRHGEKLVLKTPGSTKDYIFIDDLACAILTALEKRHVGPINFGSGLGIQIRQIAETIARELGKMDQVEEVSPEPADPLGYVVADSTLLRSLGWKPKTSLSDGLKQLIVSTLADQDQ